MKVVWVSIFMAGCAVLVVAFQAIQQEMKIRNMGQEVTSSTEDVKTKEGEILKLKESLQKLSNDVDPLEKQKTQLISKKEALVKGKETTESSLITCQKQKAEVHQKKSEKDSILKALKTKQSAEIRQAEMEVTRIQKKIMDRDSKICLYVDKNREQGVKMCAELMAASNSQQG